VTTGLRVGNISSSTPQSITGISGNPLIKFPEKIEVRNMKKKKMEEKAGNEQKVKDFVRNKHLSPAGAINCPLCWNELIFKELIRDNPYDTIIGHCGKCDEGWVIQVDSIERKMEIWSQSDAKNVSRLKGEVTK